MAETSHGGDLAWRRPRMAETSQTSHGVDLARRRLELVGLDLHRADMRNIARTHAQSGFRSVILRSVATKNLECGDF